MHIAVRNKFYDLLEILLEYGTLTDAINKRGDTPLHIAAKHGDVRALRLLLGAGADPTIKNK